MITSRESCRLAFYALAAAMLTACHHHPKSIFGQVPSVYEQEMTALTQECKAATGGATGTELLRHLMQHADSAYDAAARHARPLAEAMTGQPVFVTADADVSFLPQSPVRVQQVFLPSLRSHNGEQKVEIGIDYLNRSRDSVVYYVLTGDSGDVSFGYIPIHDAATSGRVVTQLTAPNVPAAYQESCTTMRLVSKPTYDSLRARIHELQKVWRQAYRERMAL